MYNNSKFTGPGGTMDRREDSIRDRVEGRGGQSVFDRRQFLGGLGVLGAGLALGACGSNGSSATKSPPTTAGGSPPTTAGGGSGGTGGALSAQEMATLKEMVGPIDPKYAGTGMSMKIGGAWALTGPLVYYYTIQGDALKLALDHIKQLGGPDMTLSTQNVGSASGVDPLLANNVVLKWHDSGVGSAITFDFDAGGTLIPFVQQSHIFSMDPGAGVGSFTGKDFFWGMRGAYPLNYLMQGCNYLRQKDPTRKTVSIVYYTGGQYVGLNNAIEAALRSAGFTVAGSANTAQGATDFSAAIAQLRSQRPDIVVVGSSGNDAAYFMKDYVASGINKPAVGDSFSGPQETVAGASFEGMYIVQENFLPDSPSNEWASTFVNRYRQTYGNQGSSAANSPLNLSAAYYNAGFLLWELARRVLAKGGDINNGSQIQAALMDNPTFPSIFGGSGKTPGQMSFDPTTHGLMHEPIGIFRVQKGALTLAGTADSGGGPVTVVA